MSNEKKAFVVVDLVKSYDGKSNQVDHLNFKVPYGEVYGLLGKNGAGKTTTIKILTTLIQQNSGSASICGIDVKKLLPKIILMIWRLCQVSITQEVH